jgi:hypothetical protein
MTSYTDVALEDVFRLIQGKPRHTLRTMEMVPGPYPVYSASLLKPFGHIATFDHKGPLLTWVMNGYGGRMQEVTGPFSATRDRGILLPKDGVQTPDLTYVRLAAEPQLMAAAVGRIVDGRRNNYTKLYPDVAGKVTLPIPVGADGAFDFAAMTAIGAKLRRIEAARHNVGVASDQLSRAVILSPPPASSKEVRLGDKAHFRISIGERVLMADHVNAGIPVYSANAMVPFGYVEKTNLDDFSSPSILWGIDGNFDINIIPAGEPFATTDHCGRLQITDPDIDPGYVYLNLRSTRERYGFDRVFRASLTNVSAEVEVTIPTDAKSGAFDLDAQRAMAARMRDLDQSRTAVNRALSELMRGRVRIEDLSL